MKQYQLILSKLQALGGSVSRFQWHWYHQMAAGIRRSRASQHNMYSRFAGMCFSYHGLQQPGRQNTRRPPRSTW